MFSAKVFLAAIAFAAMFSAAPGAAKNVTQRTSSTIALCIDPTSNCVAIPVVDGNCFDLTGGLSPWNKAITGVQIPIGFVCSFFEDFECADDGSNGHDRADILPGTWNMFDVEGVSGTENFNDLTSSISCSAL